jgi:hypothetical protein
MILANGASHDCEERVMLRRFSSSQCRPCCLLPHRARSLALPRMRYLQVEARILLSSGPDGHTHVAPLGDLLSWQRAGSLPFN